MVLDGIVMRTKKEPATETLVKVSRMYYEEGMTQLEISEVMGISRVNVIHLLEEARKRNIVQIKVVNPEETFDALREQLCMKYGLLDIRILPTYTDPQFLRGELGKKTAEVLLQIIKPYYTIGIGWGVSVSSVADALPEHVTDMYLEWVPLAGGLGGVGRCFQVNEITSTFQKRLGGNWYPFNVPALVDNGEIRNAILSDASISRVVDKWKSLDVALFGIGVVETSSVIKMIQASQGNLLAERSQTYAIGEVVCNCFDADGEPCEIPVDSKRIGIPYHRLKSTPIRIGVAAEKVKRNAILACVKSRLTNVLVTDKETADFLLNQPD